VTPKLPVSRPPAVSPDSSPEARWTVCALYPKPLGFEPVLLTEHRPAYHSSLITRTSSSLISLEEAAAVHYSITRSARASSDGGIVRPRALAVLRLITNSKLVGCSTGRSAGLMPLRTRSA